MEVPSTLYAAGIAHFWKNLGDEVQSYEYCKRMKFDTSDNEDRLVNAWNELRAALQSAEVLPRP